MLLSLFAGSCWFFGLFWHTWFKVYFRVIDLGMCRALVCLGKVIHYTLYELVYIFMFLLLWFNELLYEFISYKT